MFLVKENKAVGRVRTRAPIIGKHALYQAWKATSTWMCMKREFLYILVQEVGQMTNLIDVHDHK